MNTDECQVMMATTFTRSVTLCHDAIGLFQGDIPGGATHGLEAGACAGVRRDLCRASYLPVQKLSLRREAKVVDIIPYLPVITG